MSFRAGLVLILILSCKYLLSLFSLLPLIRPTWLQLHFHPAPVDQLCLNVVVWEESDSFDRQQEVFVIGKQLLCRQTPDFQHSCFHPFPPLLILHNPVDNSNHILNHIRSIVQGRFHQFLHMPLPRSLVNVGVLARIRPFIRIPAFPAGLVVPVLASEIVPALSTDQPAAPGIHA